MNDIEPARSGHIVVGVDTHKHIHVAAVMDSIGGILGTLTIATDTAGFRQLLTWALTFGSIVAFGIEGTGSYGAGLTSFARRNGHKVVEVARPDRRLRRLNGKSDSLDAENAARAVLAGFATAIPKTADGVVEMIRQLKVAHDTAVRDRTGAMVTLKAMLVHSSEELREETARKTKIMLARHCAALRPRRLETPDDANRHALRAIAKRWIALNEETTELETQIKQLVLQRAPHLVEEFGIGVDTAAEILIVVGDNPDRIKSEAAFAKLAGISPVPTGSGMTSGKHRINHGGHRQLNAAIYRTVIVRMRFHEPTIAYVTRRTAEGKSKRDIIRCLKRYVIREVYHLVKTNPKRAKSRLDKHRSINAMAEAFNSLFKAECIRNPVMRPKGGWASIRDVEIAVAEYVDWFNHRRLHGEIGLVPPAEAEATYWASQPAVEYARKHVPAGAGTN